MTPLLAQFVTEAHDLLELADASLLALERTPADTAAVNGLFRAVHTLKGSAGLFDMPAFIRLVHAGEDLLAAVRAGRVALTPDVVDRLLESLDVVRSWLDVLAGTDALPAEAHELSCRLAEGLRAHIPGPAATGGATGGTAGGTAGGDGGTMSHPAGAMSVTAQTAAWLDKVSEAALRTAFAAALAAGRPLIAIHYVPDPQCFFSGEDPLHLLRQVPDLVAMDVDTQEAWPPLGELDPYVCAVRFGLLSLGARDEVEHVFRYVAEQARIDSLAPEALIRLGGEAGTTPVHADFLDSAASLVAARDNAGLARAARALLDLSNPALRAASVLRWLLAVLEAPRPRPELVGGLLQALEDGQPPRWIAAGAETVAATVPAGRLDTSRVLMDEQRRLLVLPADAADLQGRIASVGRTLANVLTATGDAHGDVAKIEAATAAARAAGSVAPLLDCLDRVSGGAVAACAVAEAPRAFSSANGAANGGGNGGANGGGNGAANGAGNGGGDTAGHGPARTLRVDQAKIDLLMNLIGEMVVAKNGLPFLARRAEQLHGSRDMARDIKDQYAVFDRLAQEMQGAIMQVRMLPVAQMFQRFPRLVRDLARKLGKHIDLVISGEDTEADKNAIESLGDPLLHIVRNSLDHGIETPDERRAAGKPETATIRLKACQDGDTVVIEVSDDGRGIDPDRIKAKALEKGVIDDATADGLSDADAVQLVFRPGFSTAEAITDLSGRGVGMDVVRTAVEKEGGRVVLTSRLGSGTVVSLHLPLSMAVTRVMMVEVAGIALGIPMDIIAETVRIPRARMRVIKRREAMVLRDAIVPVVRMARLLGLPETAGDGGGGGGGGGDGNGGDDQAVLVVRIAEQPIGLVIDHFKEGMDIILKPMDGILAGVPGYSGTAILGDGRVLLVLNLKELL
jgi:two-component system chemotaxis sensor kinase CheA